MIAAAQLTLCLVLAAPQVVITVDDLPVVSPSTDHKHRSRVTDELLAVLKKHEIQAVGLVSWDRVGDDGEALLERWIKAGHELGNHSNKHLSLTHTESAAYIEDIEEGRRQVARLLAKHGRPPPRWFRFPFLREGDTRAKLDAVRAYLAKSKQRNLPVTIDLQDWSFEKDWTAGKNRSRVARRYQSHLKRAVEHHSEVSRSFFGREVPQVMLLHANAVGAAQWDELFTWMKSKGYTFTSVDGVIADAAYAAPHTFVSDYGHSRWDRLRAEKQNEATKKKLAELLNTQAADWNRGDLKAFTDIYADDAAFVSPSGLKQGRHAILARYQKKYDTAAKRGRLSLTVIESRIVRGPEFTREKDAVVGRIQGASTILRWQIAALEKGGPAAEGHSLITWRRTAHGWRIEQDASM